MANVARDIIDQIGAHMPEDSFHRSLDRALDHDPHTDWGVEGDALADLLNGRQEVEANDYAIRRDSSYDEAYLLNALPLRFIAGIDPGDLDLEVARSRVGVMWQIPEPVTIRHQKASLEDIEEFCGIGLIPLCERRLPVEGTE